MFIDSSIAIVDVDDFCDEWNCAEELMRLKMIFPDFKVTLFTIPKKTTVGMIRAIRDAFDWIEFAVHGILHEPNDEMLRIGSKDLASFLKSIDYSVYVKGFKPPGWYLTDGVIEACNEAGLWIALHTDQRENGPLCRHGYYVCGERFGFWHGHSHDVCGNWVAKKIDEIADRWPRDQKFMFVSEAARCG